MKNLIKGLAVLAMLAGLCGPAHAGYYQGEADFFWMTADTAVISNLRVATFTVSGAFISSSTLNVSSVTATGKITGPLISATSINDSGSLVVVGTTSFKDAVTYGSTAALAVPQIQVVVRNASGGTAAAGSVMVWASSYTAIADTNTYTPGLDVTTTTSRNAPGVAGIAAESIPAGSTGTLIIKGYYGSVLAEERGGGGFDANTGALTGYRMITSTRPYYSGYATGVSSTSIYGAALFYATQTVNGYGTWLSDKVTVTSGTARAVLDVRW